MNDFSLPSIVWSVRAENLKRAHAWNLLAMHRISGVTPLPAISLTSFHIKEWVGIYNLSCKEIFIGLCLEKMALKDLSL